MSSILTNNSAMVALQTMKSINKNMGQVQNQISTGLKVGSAKDNAATWAISKVMESDVKAFGAIRESLALGSSTVNVARNAAETTTKLLTEIKEKIVLAQEDNVDRGKIQTDITQLRDQIASVVGAAQFNGLNMVNGKSNNPVDILSSLDRASNGQVAAAKIGVDTVNLTRAEGSVVAAGDAGFAPSGATIAGAGAAGTIAVITPEGGPNVLRPNDPAAAAGAGVVAGDRMEVSLGFGGETFSVSYVARAGDTAQSVGNAIFNQLEAIKSSDTGGWISNVDFAVDTAGEITLTNNLAAAGDAIELTSEVRRGGGELRALDSLNVNGTTGQRAEALASIETMIQSAIDASAAFGSAQKRIEIQQEFVSNLMDSMKSGIGAMVDADMEEASARLQALQVQQQLGIQALSIANQQPQNILSLFR